MLRKGLLLALVLLAAAPAVAAAPPPSLIQVISRSTALHVNDHPPKGASKGDTEAMTDELTNAVRQFGKKQGAVVGSDSATVTNLGSGRASIEGSAKLPGGTILIRGAFTPHSDGTVTAPVVGGTGRYSGARGTITVAPIGSDNKLALNVYRLTYALTA